MRRRLRRGGRGATASARRAAKGRARSGRAASAERAEEAEEAEAEAEAREAWWREIFPAETADYHACQAAAERAEGERPGAPAGDTRYFYGEADLLSMDAILDAAGVEEGDAFVDLGSGAGKAVVAAALLRPQLSSARGIEMLPDLHAIAQRAAESYRRTAPAGAPALEFALGDMLAEPLGDVQIAYVFATTFPRALVQEVEMRLSAELRAGARVCLVSKVEPLPAPARPAWRYHETRGRSLTHSLTHSLAHSLTPQVFENTFLEWEEIGNAPLFQPLGDHERPVDSHAALTVTIYRKRC